MSKERMESLYRYDSHTQTHELTHVTPEKFQEALKTFPFPPLESHLSFGIDESNKPKDLSHSQWHKQNSLMPLTLNLQWDGKQNFFRPRIIDNAIVFSAHEGRKKIQRKNQHQLMDNLAGGGKFHTIKIDIQEEIRPFGRGYKTFTETLLPALTQSEYIPKFAFFSIDSRRNVKNPKKDTYLRYIDQDLKLITSPKTNRINQQELLVWMENFKLPHI